VRLRAAALLLVAATACGRSTPPKPGSPPAAAGTESVNPAESTGDDEAVAKSSVTIYFPSAGSDRLDADPREIVETGGPAERGGQILAALLAGPKAAGLLKAVPEGTELRRLWVRDDGTAYADFSEELVQGMTGGSSDELLTLYAIVDSLTLNVSEIKRVAVLVNGRERDTLGGHVDIRRPLVTDKTLIAVAKE
jgi:spore germination protein GerM